MSTLRLLVFPLLLLLLIVPGTGRVFAGQIPTEQRTSTPQTRSQDADLLATGSISGSKYYDIDGNGFRDAGDYGLPHWKIKLSGAKVDSVFTDASGVYTFAGLSDGSYTVKEDLPPGWVQSFPSFPGTYSVTISGGASITGRDFGNWPQGVIRGTQFNDLNGNGVKDPADPGLQGWIIKLTGPINGLDTTDASGTYEFLGLIPGTYTVRESLALHPGFVQTFPVAAQYSVDLVVGSRDTLNFGDFRLASIHGRKRLDVFGDSSLTGDTTLNGWVVKLYKGGVSQARLITSDSGYYKFTGLGPGTYAVEESLQVGWVQTFPRLASPGVVSPSGPNAGPRAYTVTAISGSDTARDFGNFKVGSISGKKYRDLTADSSIVGDSTLNGWVVKLYQGGSLVARTLTADSGFYKFVNLGPGVYTVEESLQVGWLQTYPRLSSSGVIAPVSSADGRRAYRAAIDSTGRTLTGINFGNFKGATISGKKFTDVLDDSLLTGDPPLNGWTVKLFRDTSVMTAVTADSGYYSFTGVGPGTYTVEEQLPTGWFESYPRTTLSGVVASTGTGSGPRAYRVVVDSSGKVFAARNFGNFQLGIVTGLKYVDLAVDSAITGDPTASGWTVKLYKFNVLTAEVPTDPSGGFSFRNLFPGTYAVEETTRTGWKQSFPRLASPGIFAPVNANDGPRAYRFAIDSSGRVFSTANFGNYEVPIISGRKFNDLNGNGLKDTGDPGIAGWKLFLSGVRRDTVLTDAGGNYTFSNLTPGKYLVREEARSGWIQTTPNPDSITIARSGAVTGIDFGNFNSVSISGKKYKDVTADSVINAGDVPLNLWVVRLFRDSTLVASTLTNGSGTYTFNGVGPGSYAVEETLMVGWRQTYPRVGSPGVVAPVSKKDGARAYAVHTASGQNITSLDFGNFPASSISGRKFQDGYPNGPANGLEDPGERGLQGFVIALQGPVGLHRDTTDAQGQYSFGNLPAGSYTISEEPQAGWIQTMPPQTVPSYHVVLPEGKDTTGLDFGNFSLGIITGVKFNDANNNRARDHSDPLIAGWHMYLFRSGLVVDSTMTDNSGAYKFIAVGPGLYTVREEQRVGWVPTFPNTSGIFGDTMKINGLDTVDFGNFGLGRITGKKFLDMNANHIRDAGEPGLQGWKINLTGPTSASALTDANGNYAFGNLAAGTYALSESLKTGWVQTYPLSGTYLLTVPLGQDTIFDFGNVQPASLAGSVYDDINANGTKDGAEVGLKGWTVRLVGSNPANNITVTTDDSGKYHMSALPSDSVTLYENVQTGWTPTTPGSGGYHLFLAGGQVEDTLNFGNFTDTGRYRTFSQTDWALKPSNLKLRIPPPPNSGNVRVQTYLIKDWYHKKNTPDALVLGIPRKDSAKFYGWATFDHLGNRVVAFLPHTGPARGFDLYAGRRWVGNRHTPSVKFHNNHLAGELFALKFNVGASDVGITPKGLANLIFYDSSALTNPCNGKTIRQIMGFADSAMTFWKRHDASYFNQLDTVLSKINRAFLCETGVIQVSPLKIRGCRTVEDVRYLLPNPHPAAVTTPPDIASDQIPLEYVLKQNYPNPFNPITTIEFGLASPSIVTLKVYNVLGQEVATLLNRESMDEGEGAVDFNAAGLASGVYFYKLVAEGIPDAQAGVTPPTFVSIKKMMLLR